MMIKNVKPSSLKQEAQVAVSPKLDMKLVFIGGNSHSDFLKIFIQIPYSMFLNLGNLFI